MAFIMATQPRKKGSAFYTLCSKRSLWGTAGPYIQLPCFCKRGNKKIPLKSHDLRGICYRSGETRTRGLLLPKQARYQLRNTPASGGTAAPPEYSISFFAWFVNTESAVRGIGAFRLFQPIKAAVRKRAMTGIFCKKVRFWCNCRKADAKTGQNTKFVAL